MAKNRYQIDFDIDTTLAKRSIKSLQGEFSGVSKSLERSLTRSINGLIQGTKGLKDSLKDIAREIAVDFAKTQVDSIFSGSTRKASGLGGVIGGLGKIAGFFESGGIVPGSYSQAMPIVAHGSEMVLNPSQQANMFRMINGQGATRSAAQPNYVYAPQVKTGASASEVFDVLQKHSRQFFSMVAEGVSSDSGLRNAVRGG